jgi:hypothetical protein
MQNITHLRHTQLQGIVNTETTLYNPIETTHFPHISKKNQQRLINDYISSITLSGNKFFTAFKKSKTMRTSYSVHL